MELSKDQLKQLLSTTSSLGENVLEFENDKTLTEQGVDSLDMLDFLLKIEESYQINIPDTDVDNVNTIDKLYDYLKERS